MDLLTILLLTAVFLFAVCLVAMIYLVWAESRFASRRALRKRLLYISAGGKQGKETLDLYKKKALKNAGFFERLTFSLPRISALDRMLIKAGIPINASTFCMISIAMGSIGLLLGMKLLPHLSGAIGLGALLLALPFLFLRVAERKNLTKFKEQLPEALDFLARALRSGHAITSGFEMLATEMEDPVKSEFAATVDEINLGLSFKEALENLCTRVPDQDLRFFAIAISIQRETGGNIAEILDGITHLIRERVKFQRLVKSLTADGRISALILLFLPVALFIYLYIVTYDYISLLWRDQLGIYMMVSAVLSMIFGGLVLKKIVSVEM